MLKKTPADGEDLKNAESLDPESLTARNIQEDYELAEEEYKAQKQLIDNKVISMSEFERNKVRCWPKNYH